MWLYALLLTGSCAVPFALSFDKKLRFRQKWYRVLPAIIAVAFIYILFDILFNNLGVWGFNERYHSGLLIAGIPLEECLFFLAIPFASLFIHYAFFFSFPKAYPGKSIQRIITLALLLASVLVIAFNTEKAYTIYAFGAMTAALLLSFADKTSELSRFYVSFLIILIPFMIVNGILTGSLIEKEVVWYNPDEILGWKVLTIPAEDFVYGFSLILFNLLVINLLNHGKPLYEF